MAVSWYDPAVDTIVRNFHTALAKPSLYRKEPDEHYARGLVSELLLKGYDQLVALMATQIHWNTLDIRQVIEGHPDGQEGAQEIAWITEGFNSWREDARSKLHRIFGPPEVVDQAFNALDQEAWGLLDTREDEEEEAFHYYGPVYNEAYVRCYLVALNVADIIDKAPSLPKSPFATSVNCHNCNKAVLADPTFRHVLDDNAIEQRAVVFRCPACDEWNISLTQLQSLATGESVVRHNERRVLLWPVPPGFAVDPLPSTLPSDIASEFEKAVNVLDTDPATCLFHARKCLEGILKTHLGGRYKRGTLQQAIDAAIEQRVLKNRHVSEFLQIARRTLLNEASHYQQGSTIDEQTMRRWARSILFVIDCLFDDLWRISELSEKIRQEFEFREGRTQ